MSDYISSHSGAEIDAAVSAVAGKVDKVTGKDLSTNDLTNELLTLLTTNKVKSIATDALNGKLVVTYTDDTVANLNINDIVTDVYVSGATLDATTNVLTLTSTSGGADVIVDLSTFVNSDEIMNYYTKDETDAIHESLVTTSVGQSVSYFLGDTIVSGGNYDLTTYPDGDVETVISATAVNANTSYFMERYISDPVGGTVIDGGIWVFRTYASVNSTNGISEIVCRINKRTAKTGTITTTGTGLTRTVTSTVPIFVAGDADASILNASLIETLTETFWISSYISATQVTITLSSSTYVNETAVPFYMYYKLFEASTGEINATVATLYEANSIQPEFAILPEDSILIAYFVRTTSTNKTISLYKGGTEHYSHIVTPLVYRHNSLKGLNEGDYQHLTATQLTKLNTIESIALTITNKTIDDITNSIGADHIHYKVRNNTVSTITKGTVVKATGSQPGTDYITIEPTSSTSDVGIGIVHSDILSNGVGLVVNTGETKNINTSAWTVGTILYTAAGGTFTNTKPTTGIYQASAYVLRQHATQGVLLVEFSEPVYISSTTQSGYVQLNDTLTSTSTTQALTAAQGKALQDNKLAVSGGNLTGALNTARATVASSATTSQIWTALGNQIDWTGTATTTIFPNAPQAGAERTLICAGACSFTAGANMLIDGVASGSSVTCAVGDTVIVRAISTTQFKLTRLKADGTAQVSAGGGFTKMQVFNASGTFNIASAKGAGVYYIEAVGGGGAGGSCPSKAYAKTSGGGGGGGVRLFVNLTADVPVTIGSGGTPIASAQGGDGGTTTFGTFATANGGQGGRADSNYSIPLGGGASYGAGVLSAVLRKGQNGGLPFPATTVNQPGLGGVAAFNTSYSNINIQPNTTQVDGVNGFPNTGCGGTGCTTKNADITESYGGSGGSGYVIVYW